MKPFVINFDNGSKNLINLDKVLYVEYSNNDGCELLILHFETEWQVQPNGEHSDMYEEHATYSTQYLQYSDGAGLKVFNNIVSCMDEQKKIQDALLNKLDMLIKKIK